VFGAGTLLVERFCQPQKANTFDRVV